MRYYWKNPYWKVNSIRMENRFFWALRSESAAKACNVTFRRNELPILRCKHIWKLSKCCRHAVMCEMYGMYFPFFSPTVPLNYTPYMTSCCKNKGDTIWICWWNPFSLVCLFTLQIKATFQKFKNKHRYRFLYNLGYIC